MTVLDWYCMYNCFGRAWIPHWYCMCNWFMVHVKFYQFQFLSMLVVLVVVLVLTKCTTTTLEVNLYFSWNFQVWSEFFVMTHSIIKPPCCQVIFTSNIFSGTLWVRERPVDQMLPRIFKGQVISRNFHWDPPALLHFGCQGKHLSEL